MQLRTLDEVRGFLQLCLDPGRGIKRTPAKLVKVMPQVLRERLEFYAPDLAALRVEAERLEAMAAVARRAHVAAVSRWITPPAGTEGDSAPMETTTSTAATAPAGKARKPKERGECRACGLTYAMNSGLLAFHHGMTPSGFSTGRRCEGVDLMPFFVVGA